MSTFPLLVSTGWLADHLDAVKVVDATFFLPGQGDAAASFLAAHVPGAVRFDIDAVADRSNPLPHMLPDAAGFAAGVGALGISSADHVVAYGVAGPRVWWMFRAMGHDKVSVLDGGLAKWIAEGRPTEAGERETVPAVFTAKARPELVRGFNDVVAALGTQTQILDARPGPRFTAEAPSRARWDARRAMPGALNLPSVALFAEDGTFRSKAEVAAQLQAAGYDPSRPAITTCGSGVTACMIALVLARQGRWDTAVYDGSWTEWGGRADSPIVTG